MDPIVEYRGVSKKYGQTTALQDIDLIVPPDDFMVVYGLPSSGKSVLLRLLMGLEEPDGGEIFLRGENVGHMPPMARNIGYVPQDFALIPHKTIYENIAYPLGLMKKPAREIKPVVERAAAMLSIADLLDKLPTQLSGGQKQRVAVARGIVKQTDIYLFDDPLAGLDFKLREKLIDDLKRLQEELGVCFIYGTSDPIESLALGATIAVLHGHTIVETGEPHSIYADPQCLSTMEILGFPRANLLEGNLVKDASRLYCRTQLLDFQVREQIDTSAMEDSMPVTVAVRPEDLHKASDAARDALRADIYMREDLGAEEIIYLNIGDCSLTMLNPSSQNESWDVGDQIKILIDPNCLFVFDQHSGMRIGKGID